MKNESTSTRVKQRILRSLDEISIEDRDGDKGIGIISRFRASGDYLEQNPLYNPLLTETQDNRCLTEFFK